MAPPAVVVKENVAAMGLFAATLSFDAKEKVGIRTLLPI
jgi:hypothetical protein